jgi:peptide/nickel transport system substrate-binding protein
MQGDYRYWASARSSVSRRRFLGGSMAAGAGLAGAALIGCGSSSETTPAASGGTGGAATGGTAAPSGPTVASITGDSFTNREPNGVPKMGGTLNWSPGSPTLANLDPLTSASAMVHQVAMPSYSGLMQIGRDPKDRNSPTVFYPELATKWEIQPTKMVFTLREGVKFHNVAPVNGRVFTSEDAKYAINRVATDKVSLFRGAYSDVSSIETPDPKTLVINMKKFNPLMMTQLAGHFGWMYPKELEEGSKFRETIVGTGPFIFQRWEKDARVSYKKNPDYYIKGAPFVDELNWFIIGNEDTRTAAFRSGQTQIYDVPDNAIKDTKANKDVTVEDYLRVAPQVLFMNAKEDRWKDERVRKAVALTLDTGVLLKTLQNGNGLWRGIVSNQHAGWTLSQDELKSKKYFMRQDLAEAKQLMAAAGHPDGISAGLLYSTSYPQSYQDSTQYIAQTLTTNKIVNVKLDGKDLATMRKGQDEQTYDGLCFGLDGQGAPESFLLDYKSNGPKNGSGLKNAEVDADVDKVMAIVDVKERQAATKAFVDKWLQKAMYKLEFVDGTNYTAWTKEVKNFVDGPPFWYRAGHAFTWLDKA